MKKPGNKKRFFFHLFATLLIAVLFITCIPFDLDIDDDPGAMPVADFEADFTTILPNNSVQFSDLSDNSPNSWWWQFGDGGTSLLQNPSHTYTDFGSFDVTLTATNSNGSHTSTKNAFITVGVEIGPTGTVTDIDGNTYETIKIGPQWWMAENLMVSSYANGAGIQYISDDEDWLDLDLDAKAYSAYDYNLSNIQNKGALYSWNAAVNGEISTKNNPIRVQGVCPSGWHLPNDEEWAELEINLGMKNTVTDDYGYRGTNEGSKMAGGSNLWQAGALRNNPDFGFSGMEVKPYGYQSGSGTSLYLGEESFFWTATTYGSGSGDKAWDRRFLHDFAGVYRDFAPYYSGMYVRCVKD